MRRISLTLAIIMLSLFAVTVMAGPDNAYKKAETSKETTIKGTMVCLGCELKKGDGANAECKDFGHTHALKTEDGKLVSLLENKFAKDLMSDKYHGKNVEINGTMFANANILDVQSFSVDGKNKSWCGGCKSMDGCSAK